MAWNPIPGVFPHHSQCSRYTLQSFRDPDQDKTLTEDEFILKISLPFQYLPVKLSEMN